MEPASIPDNVTPLREGDLAHYRTPPHNAEAEQALLGAILSNNAAYGRVSDFLRTEHFAAAVVTIINAEDYGRTIHDLFLRRQLIVEQRLVRHEADPPLNG